MRSFYDDLQACSGNFIIFKHLSGKPLSEKSLQLLASPWQFCSNFGKPQILNTNMIKIKKYLIPASFIYVFKSVKIFYEIKTT